MHPTPATAGSTGDLVAAAEVPRSPLAAEHEALGARTTVFAGTEMPLRYAGELEEHRAVRQAAGLFDLSHMGEIEVTGPGAGAALDAALSTAPSRLTPGRARYSLLLTPEGGVLDDLIVYRLGEERFLVVANAGNREVVARELTERARGHEACIRDRSDEYVLLAVQGPAAARVLAATPGLELPEGTLDTLRSYRSAEGTFGGAPLLAARTGYTGEDGFELYVPVAVGAALWRALLTAGGAHGLVPCGLACRDTLRLEAGMPLYGQELSTDIRPAQAGLGRVVDTSKPGDFVGRAALEADDGAAARRLVGLRGAGRRAGRTGYPVYAATAGATGAVGVGTAGTVGDAPDAVSEAPAPVGEVTSGALSPTLGAPIAMAFVDPAVAVPGTALEIDVRGTRLPVDVVELPFYRRG